MGEQDRRSLGDSRSARAAVALPAASKPWAVGSPSQEKRRGAPRTPLPGYRRCRNQLAPCRQWLQRRDWPNPGQIPDP